MGFGSYDESEQKDPTIETDDEGSVDSHENDHDGEVTYEDDGMTTDDLVDQLQDVKANKNNETNDE